MSEMQTTTTPIVYAGACCYHDAIKMIGWLERAFGFKKHAVYMADDGNSVVHAEMAYGSSILMMSSFKKTGVLAKHVRPPSELGANTQSVYIAVPDPDAVYRTAKAAGAEIVMELADQPYGSRDFICKDPEGYVWCFGTYAPTVK